MLKPQFLLTNKIPITILRKTEGRRINGIWVPGVEQQIEMQVNIQPLKPYEIQQFPESERTRAWFKVYSAEVLRTLKEGSDGWAADEFIWKGDRYRVMKVDDWTSSMGILEHTKSYCARVPLTPN